MSRTEVQGCDLQLVITTKQVKNNYFKWNQCKKNKSHIKSKKFQKAVSYTEFWYEIITGDPMNAQRNAFKGYNLT